MRIYDAERVRSWQTGPVGLVYNEKNKIRPDKIS